jgi:hypothetical protein
LQTVASTHSILRAKKKLSLCTIALRCSGFSPKINGEIDFAETLTCRVLQMLYPRREKRAAFFVTNLQYAMKVLTGFLIGLQKCMAI